MKWIKRTHLTAMNTLDKFENLMSNIVHWIFNIAMIYVYENILLKIITCVVYILNFIFYTPLFMLFLPFSIAVELFLYTQKTKIKSKSKVQKEEEKLDLINKS